MLQLYLLERLERCNRSCVVHELRCNWCQPQLTAATGGNWCGCNNRNWWQLVQVATHKPQLVATGAPATTATGGNWRKPQLTSRNWWQLVQPQLVATGASRNSQPQLVATGAAATTAAAATGGNWCKPQRTSRNWWQLVQPQLVATGASRNSQPQVVATGAAATAETAATGAAATTATSGNWCSRHS